MLIKAPKHRAMIICEDIRNEAGNKTTLCGIFSNGIVFQEGEHTKSLPQFCVYGLFEPVQEGCKSTLSITSPSGEVVIEIPSIDIPANEETALCVGIKIQGITFNELGVYKVIFKFDEKKVTMPFTVSTAKTMPT